jgi:hypothetical protein
VVGVLFTERQKQEVLREIDPSFPADIWLETGEHNSITLPCRLTVLSHFSTIRYSLIPFRCCCLFCVQKLIDVVVSAWCTGNGAMSSTMGPSALTPDGPKC